MTTRPFLTLRIAALAALVGFANVQPAPAALTLEKQDRICIIGSGLADRLQHDGWLETVLHSAYPKHYLTIRNLGYTGDTVWSRPRNSGFPSQDQYLKDLKADVIFIMFGYNESFGGVGGLTKYRDELGKLVDHYRKMKPNGKSAPKIVLFSPIAHEDLGSPNLPDGKANNSRLSAYAASTKAVADSKQTGFVDLFTPSSKLFDSSNIPLTINGVHLNPEGNRRIAEVIAKSLLGKEIPASPSLDKVRKAVLDKNWHWHNRYRATDGNDVWGGRSGLKFVDGQSNKDVLWHELSMIDIMVANRDMAVWAAVGNHKHKIDDSNVPAPIAVKSNVGGKSRSSNAGKEGNLKGYNTGKEGLAKLTVPKDMEVNLFADEKMFPELINPVQMAVDTKGRLWAAAWPTYPKWEPLKKMDDRLLIFPDENRDGVADKCITFAKVHNPTGFEFWNGGVLVASQPDVLFLKDTDGDDVADVRIRLLQGIGSADTHHAANAFAMGPDGAFYWQSGVFFRNAHEHPWGPPLHSGASAMFRFDPRQYTVTVHAGNSPNPHGVCFDYWGRHYANDGTGGRSYQVRPEGKGFRMHGLVKKEVRPVAGSGVVSSANFPDEQQGDYILANTIGFLGVKQYDLEPKNEEDHMWGEPRQDLIKSSDKNFRPSDVEFGSDGALYVSDWHNVIIGHMQHNIRDPSRDHLHGRIYRVVNKKKPLQKAVKVDGASLDELMANLEHPVDGVRYRTRIELSERNTKEVIAACQKWLKKWDHGNKDHAHHILEGLWVHQQHNVRDMDLLGKVLKSPVSHARVAAKTVQHLWTTADPTKGSVAVAEVEVTKNDPPGVFKDTDEATDVRVGTLLEQLKFDIKEFEVKAGKKIRIHFKNSDYVPHNLVIVKPGAANGVGEAAIKLGEAGFKAQWVPKHDGIIAHSKLLDFGKAEVLEFTAPKEAGNYEFVCTFPGHHILMRGVMKVK
ncbi:MAG: GDSL-type esterase/lipase family protein, partial [Roseibacillus sp.]|nr:GDSL-type esterase/lipase family protein [Roseibacillus sp.]